MAKLILLHLISEFICGILYLFSFIRVLRETNYPNSVLSWAEIVAAAHVVVAHGGGGDCGVVAVFVVISAFAFEIRLCVSVVVTHIMGLKLFR